MNQPLISCIMPTKNRRAFVAQSLRYFAQQDYPNKELIVVDDGDDLVVDLVSQIPHVHYLAPQYAHSVGMKRNIACEEAQGEIICHWDDDDWYSPSRLSYQVEALLSGYADITGLHFRSVLDIQNMKGWQCADSTEETPGVEGLHYGTAIYWKHLWTNLARFQDSPRGDDGSGFVRRLINHGARAYTLPCKEHQTYVRHGANIWKYQPGTTINSEKWYPAPLDQCVPLDDFSFYRQVNFQLRQQKQARPATVYARECIDRFLVKKIAPIVFSLKQ